MGDSTVRAGQPRGGVGTIADAKRRTLQKAANKLANEMMRKDGLDPVKDQTLRVQYYMRARADLMAPEADER